MQIINPGFTEIHDENPQKHIEYIARTCYKSNDLITDDSNKRFIKNIYDRQHWAMLEHYIFIYEIPGEVYDHLNKSCYKYFICTNYNYKVDNVFTFRCIASFSARSLLDILCDSKLMEDQYTSFIIEKIICQIIHDYNCAELFGNEFEGKYDERYRAIKDINILTDKERLKHGWHSIKFICDRGVSHEIVRHRDASFAQESTRYCNYAKDKFGKEITVIKPCYLKDGSDNPNEEMVAWGIWTRAIENSEKAYFEMLDVGCSPQEARAVLPNSLKTEVIMTARNYEWQHFFSLRCDKAAHPQMRELALPLFDYLSLKDNNLFHLM